MPLAAARLHLQGTKGAGTRTGHEVEQNAPYLQQQGPLRRVQLGHPGLGLDEEVLGVLNVLGGRS